MRRRHVKVNRKMGYATKGRARSKMGFKAYSYRRYMKRKSKSFHH